MLRIIKENRLKALLFLLIFLSWTPTTASAKNTTFTSNPYIDYNFTKNHVLLYSDGIFKIGKITIMPSINISNAIKNLTNINNNIIMKDFGYYHEFGFNLSGVSLSSISSIMFDLKGMKRYDDVSFTDGTIRLVFNDLMDKGSLKIINDSRIILYNPTTLSIDPIIELLSNSTNRAYYSISLEDNNITRNFANATTEATATEYNKINTSNNISWSLSVFRVIATQYRTKKFTFNLSSVDSPINSITYCYEGYHDYMETGFEYLYWYNVTLKNWQLDQITNYDSDTTICKSFATTQQINDFYNNTSKQIIIGTRFSGNWLLDTTSSNTDFLNLTVDYGANTCTYSSGNWFININDNCTLSTPNTVNGNIYVYGSNGYLNFQAKQSAHAFYYNVTSLGSWYYNSYRWLY